jgi:5-methylcytosine-specific restriction endonuclease McrA
MVRTFSSPVSGFAWTPEIFPGILASAMLMEIGEMAWDEEDRIKYAQTWADKSDAQRAKILAAQREKAAAKAVAEGREPGKVGRPARLTPEEKEASRIKQNKRRSLRTRERIRAARAAKAVLEGREPGKVGGPRRLTDEERIVNRRDNYARWRTTNLEEVRARDAELHRIKTAARALAEGRVPGVIGHLATFTEAELIDYLDRWPDRNSVFHARIKSQNSRAKRLNVPGELTLVDIYAAVAEQAGICAFCANPFGDEVPEIDHWIPMARGGHNTADNVKLLHVKCNRTKGAKLPEEIGLVAPAPSKGD